MPVEVLRELALRLPKVRLWNLYGQTEIAPLATMLGPEDQLRKPGSCGRAVLNVETRVVDDAMNDVAPGVVGEVVHRSPHLMLGYFHDDARTTAAFEGGWFHSGDLAVIDEEGYITIVDRKKDMIKTGGENVASREVEEALYLMPQVSEVAVVGVPHPRWVEAVVAVVVAKSGAALSEDDVLAACLHQACVVQDAEAHRFRRYAAQEPQRETVEAPVARPLCGPVQGALIADQNKLQGKARSARLAVFHDNGGRMQFGDALHDGQTKARAPGLPAIAAPEALKDQVAFARRKCRVPDREC